MGRWAPSHPSRAGWLLVLIASLPVSYAWSEDATQGRFLVASRGLADPNFARSVVLLLRHDADGAMGIIVNRPTRVSAQEVLPEVDALADYPAPIPRDGRRRSPADGRDRRFRSTPEGRAPAP